MQWLEAILGSPYFDQGVAAATAAGVIGAPLVWAAKRRHNGYQIRKTVAKGLCAELEDTIKALDGTDGRKQSEVRIADLESSCPIPSYKKISYTLAFLNHDAYDSFLYAGHLVMLDANLVQDIQNVYQRVKHHNKWLEHLMPLHDKESETGKSNLTVTNTYYSLLNKYEAELLEMIPALKKRLEVLCSFWSWFGRWPC